MRTWLFALSLAFAAGLLAASWPLYGQEGTVESRATADDSSEQEVKPSGFYLRNERGDLIYVPDYSYEKFDQLLKQQRELADPPRPTYSLQAMNIAGTVRGERLEASVEFTIEGLGQDDSSAGTGSSTGRWHRVPLQFNSAFLRAEPQFTGAGRHFLTFEEEAGGYVCWLQESAEGVHQITLPLVIPIDRVGEESRFSLRAPSPLSSTAQIVVPENPAEGSLEEQLTKSRRPLAFTTNERNEGVFAARGIRGEVTLQWRASRITEDPVTVGLDVFGNIVVTADELLQEVRTDGRFVIRGFGGPLEVLQVRLPPGMQLREIPEPGYEINTIRKASGAEQDGQLVEIRLDRPTATETEIRLVAELPSNDDDPDWPLTINKLIDSSLAFMPARFEFEGAVRHRGQIDLAVKGDWSLLWEDDVALPRLNTNGKTGINELWARFRYYDQDHPLRVWLRQQAARISVEPNYEVYVDSKQARLFARLNCRTSGSKAGSLKVTLPGWTTEIISFADFDSSLPVDTRDNTLVIPIPLEAQASGQFVLQLEARQDLTTSVISGNAPLRAVMPTLTAENPTHTDLIVGPATVTITPADNILLTPRSPNMQALSPLVAPLYSSTLPDALANDAAADSVPAADQENLYQTNVLQYRDRGASEQAVFVGDFKIQPQTISVTVSTTVTLDRRSYGVEQLLAYRVLHEPVDTLTLGVPVSLLKSGRGSLRFLMNDEPLIPVAGGTSGQSRAPVLIRLPRPLLGPVQLRIIHPRQPLAEWQQAEQLQVSVPLVSAAAGNDHKPTVIGNTLTVLHQRPIGVEIEGTAWTVTESESGVGRLVATTAADGPEATLGLSLGGQGTAQSTVLEQMWVQSWLTDVERRDRVVFRLRTSDSELQVNLPTDTGGDLSALEVAVDQARVVSIQSPEEGSVRIPIPEKPLNSIETHVVELWYRVPFETSSKATLAFQPATLNAIDHVERRYWQLVLPPNQLVLTSGQPQTSRFAWQGWAGWRRTPLRQQRDLENWIGAARQAPIPPAMNTYLFSSFGAQQPLQVTICARSLLLFVASAVALLMGLLLIYVPVLRHPAVLLVLGVVVLALSLTYPDLAILIAQASSLGVILSLAALLLRNLLSRGQTTTAAGATRPQYTDSKLLELRYARTGGSSKVTTASAPIGSHASSAESQS